MCLRSFRFFCISSFLSAKYLKYFVLFFFSLYGVVDTRTRHDLLCFWNKSVHNFCYSGSIGFLRHCIELIIKFFFCFLFSIFPTCTSSVCFANTTISYQQVSRFICSIIVFDYNLFDYNLTKCFFTFVSIRIRRRNINWIKKNVGLFSSNYFGLNINN